MAEKPIDPRIDEALKKCNPQKAIYALAEVVDQYDTQIQCAQNTANQALQDAAAAATTANEAKQEAAQATVNVGEAFDNARVSPNSSTVVVEFDRINDNAQNVALPVVNTTNAGILNANDYKFFQEYDARIRAVEGVSKIYLVELPSDNPSSQQITLAYTSQWPDAPNPPLEGTVVVDPARDNLSYRWNTQSNTWYKISEVAINQFTNTTLGTIKGSTSDGEVQANADGTGSVTGWDIVKGNITTLQENSLAQIRLNPTLEKITIEQINGNNQVKNTSDINIVSDTLAGLMSPGLLSRLESANRAGLKQSGSVNTTSAGQRLEIPIQYMGQTLTIVAEAASNTTYGGGSVQLDLPSGLSFLGVCVKKNYNKNTSIYNQQHAVYSYLTSASTPKSLRVNMQREEVIASGILVGNNVAMAISVEFYTYNSMDGEVAWATTGSYQIQLY